MLVAVGRRITVLEFALAAQNLGLRKLFRI